MSETVVANQFPSTNPGATRLAVAGECPGVEEVNWATCASGHGFSTRHWMNKALVSRDRCDKCGTRDWKPTPKPFCGESGRLLNDVLLECGLPRDRVFVGNASRLPLSEAEKNLDDPSVRSGLSRLAIDLEDFCPNAVLCLGNLSFSAFFGPGKPVTNWRGSIVRGELEGVSYKVICAVHPAAILREPSQLALFRKDCQRAVEEAAYPELRLPERTFWHVKGDGLMCEVVR